MRWPTLAVAALALSSAGCDKIPLPFVGKKADTTAADTTRVVRAAPATEPAAPTAPQARPAAQRPSRALVDEPWTPLDTGTVRPGMTREEVIARWGVPVAERTMVNRIYLYFRNGCEVTCGTFDVVFLEDGQVVDAIVRGPGHHYAGVSSSPPDRPAEFTPPRSPEGEIGERR